MNKVKQAPRISRIIGFDGFNIVCRFTNNEQKVVDFKKLLAAWNPVEGDPEFLLLDLAEFQKVELRDGILTWPNVPMKMEDWNGIEHEYPFDLDPLVAYESGVKLKTRPAAEPVPSAF